MTPKRVGALYRVSTKGQLNDENDIPLQRNACHEFANKMGWEIIKEYYEGGVSGFKISSEDRDAILEAKNDAISKNIDILLVFLFDRVGRRDEETPFVVEWFTKNGVEVWSVKEGQRKFETHVDNLINYITFWQSSGESKKTSIRVKEAMKQMVEEGRFKGGTPPYGYDLMPSGVFNKRDKELDMLVINEEEKKVIKTIFDLYTNYGYGCLRISNYLNKNKIPTKTGKLWIRSTISKLLQNPIYIGRLRLERIISEVYEGNKPVYKPIKRKTPIYNKDILSNLIIIDENQFNIAQEILSKKNNSNKKSNLNIPSSSPLLFLGYIYCGYCKEKMTIKHHYVYWTNKDGTKHKYIKYKYVCKNRKEKGHTVCQGKFSYSNTIVENDIMTIIKKYISNIRESNLDEQYLIIQKNLIKELQKKINMLLSEQKKISLTITKLEEEIENVVLGESDFDKKTLSNLITKNNDKLNLVQQNISDNQTELAEKEYELSNYSCYKNNVEVWSNLFEKADNLDRKKMLLSSFINKIYVYENRYEIEYNYDIEKYLQGV